MVEKEGKKISLTRFLILSISIFFGLLIILIIFKFFGNLFFRDYILLLDNLVLFFFIIIFPLLFSSNFTEDIKRTDPKIIKKEGTYYYLKPEIFPENYKKGGIVLIYSSSFSILYSVMDFFLFKRIFLSCEFYCGLENVLSIFLSLVYLTIGFLLMKTKFPRKTTGDELFSQLP